MATRSPSPKRPFQARDAPDHRSPPRRRVRTTNSNVLREALLMRRQQQEYQKTVNYHATGVPDPDEAVQWRLEQAKKLKQLEQREATDQFRDNLQRDRRVADKYKEIAKEKRMEQARQIRQASLDRDWEKHETKQESIQKNRQVALAIKHETEHLMRESRIAAQIRVQEETRQNELEDAALRELKKQQTREAAQEKAAHVARLRQENEATFRATKQEVDAWHAMREEQLAGGRALNTSTSYDHHSTEVATSDEIKRRVQSVQMAEAQSRIQAIDAKTSNMRRSHKETQARPNSELRPTRQPAMKFTGGTTPVTPMGKVLPPRPVSCGWGERGRAPPDHRGTPLRTRPVYD